MHILHILDHSIPLHSGYSFRTRALLEQQHLLGWNTSHLTSAKQGSGDVADESVDGLHFYRSPPLDAMAESLPVINQIAVVRGLSRRLREVCELEKPDILHAHSPCLNGLAALRIGRRLGLPVIYEMRASWEDAATQHGTSTEGSLRYKLSRSLETYVLRRADGVTTICNGLRDDISSRGIAAQRITVVPNAVDADQFEERPPNPDLVRRLALDGKQVLGFAGSFYSYEGLHLLLRAMPAILRAQPAVRLLLVGGGPEEDRLKALAAELKLTDAVVFTGRVPHEKVSEYYDLVDIFVYPRVSSRLTETVTPLKPLEAMAQRRLVVASNVGGHLELIRDGETGVLFEADDVANLAQVTTNLLSSQDEWQRLRDAGRRFVENERSWRESVARYERVYRDALS